MRGKRFAFEGERCGGRSPQPSVLTRKRLIRLLIEHSPKNGFCDTQDSHWAKRLEAPAGIEMLDRRDPGLQSVVEGDREGARFTTDDCRRKAKTRDLQLDALPESAR